MPILEDIHRLIVLCDHGAHSPGDSTALGTFEGRTRGEALASTIAAGWLLAPDGPTTCPRHAAQAPAPGTLAAALATGAAATASSAELERAITHWRRSLRSRPGRVAAFRDDCLPGSRSWRIVPDESSEALLPLGELHLLKLNRSWDRIMPPGAVSQPYGTRADILCAGQRDRPHNSTNDRMVANWEASFRHPLDQALAALGGESLAAALGSYAMEWHIEDGDAWSIFARGTDRDPWWQGEGMAHLGMRELIDAAMTAFAPGVRDALVPQHRRR